MDHACSEQLDAMLQGEKVSKLRFDVMQAHGLIWLLVFCLGVHQAGESQGQLTPGEFVFLMLTLLAFDRQVIQMLQSLIQMING